MKLCLIFAPLGIPTAAPLGMAHLKSFVEKNSSNKVKNIDLNLEYYNRIINKFLNEEFNIYKDKERNMDSRILIRKGIDIFKKGGDDFFKQDDYNICANEFLFLFEKVAEKNNDLLLRYIYNKMDLSDALLPYLKKTEKEKPDMVGFSVLSAEQLYHSIALAKLIKQELDVRVVFGGGAIRLFPERFLEHYSDFIDFVINGEGEEALLKLIENGKTEKIPNLVYKKDNKIIKNKEKNIDNLDRLPAPDYSDFSLQDYFCPKIVLGVLSSRGCYWRKCAFCDDCNSTAMQYRTRSTEGLIEEIKFLKKKYNSNYFFFADEMIHPAKFMEISKAFIDKKADINYYTQARATKEFNKELLSNIYKSGCKVLMWGIESGCQRILDLMGKGINVEEVARVLRNSHNAGIKNAVFAFGGFPTEKEEEYKQTLSFLDKNRDYIDVQFIGYFRLTKGSSIYKNPEKYGITEFKENKDAWFLVPLYDYKVKEGITPERSKQFLEKNFNFFLNLNKFSPFLGKLRDHMLVYYSVK